MSPGDPERAVSAPGPRRATPLRAEIERFDRQFAAKSVNNPFADPALPWWARRFWH